MQKNFFRTMKAQEERKSVSSLKEAVEKFLEMEEHKFKYNEKENKFIVERNMLSMDIIKNETFAKSVEESLKNIYPKKEVRKINEINDYKIEIYI